MATDGRGAKDMVVLPYKDRLLLFSRYLQQLIMESIGKEFDRDGNQVQGLREMMQRLREARQERLDRNDLIFKTKEARFAAVIEDIKERHEKGQPVLLGTIAVETSEYISALLTMDRDNLAKWAARKGLSEISYETLTQHPELRRTLDRFMASANAVQRS